MHLLAANFKLNFRFRLIKRKSIFNLRHSIENKFQKLLAFSFFFVIWRLVRTDLYGHTYRTSGTPPARDIWNLKNSQLQWFDSFVVRTFPWDSVGVGWTGWTRGERQKEHGETQSNINNINCKWKGTTKEIILRPLWKGCHPAPTWVVFSGIRASNLTTQLKLLPSEFVSSATKSIFLPPVKSPSGPFSLLVSISFFFS